MSEKIKSVNSDELRESSEDILNDALSFLGGKPVIEEDIISYGPLRLTVAPKEGKANTLLADHLFSPSLFLAERIERGLMPVAKRTVVELGAGCALPSLLLSTITEPPPLIVVTDHPDSVILGSLKRNVERNSSSKSSDCDLYYLGYDWGTDPSPLLSLLPVPHSVQQQSGFDVVIMSDLLHFHSSHDSLIASLQFLLRRSPDARVYVAAGKYTSPEVCDNFLSKGSAKGLVFEEINPPTGEETWLGNMKVSGLDREALSVRKEACRFWIGRWS